MNKIFSLNEPFKFKWLLRKGFWKIIWSGIIAYFGWTTTMGDDSEKITIGTRFPVNEILDHRYWVKISGWVFGWPIYFYTKIQ